VQQTSHAFLQSFGRRRGRKLRANREELVESLLPKLLIRLPDGTLDPATLFIKPKNPLWFEIGFGGGEHLVEQARRNPQCNFLGCEPYINGVAKLLSAIDKDKLDNIRLYDGDARLLLERLPDASIERMFILFPDPWPKARHHKRRIISQTTLTLLHKKIIAGGMLRLATDHVEYGAWMLEQLQAFKKFSWMARNAEDWNEAPADWVVTRYQQKAAGEGRNPLFLNYLRD